MTATYVLAAASSRSIAVSSISANYRTIISGNTFYKEGGSMGFLDDAKAKANDVADDVKDKAEDFADKAHEVAEDAKDQVQEKIDERKKEDDQE